MNVIEKQILKKHKEDLSYWLTKMEIRDSIEIKDLSDFLYTVGKLLEFLIDKDEELK